MDERIKGDSEESVGVP